MKPLRHFLLVALLTTMLAAPQALACTTMIITPGASADGSMMVTHSDDDELGDQRLIFVPAKEQTGSRKIYPEAYAYPRIVTNDRGPAYDTRGYPPTEPVGTVPYAEIWKILGRE